MTKKEIEKVAFELNNEVVEYFSLKRGQALPVLKILEHFMREVYEVEYEVTALNEDNIDKEAEYCPATNTILIREDIYNNAYKGVSRSRFTIGHEIGHAIMHKSLAFTSNTYTKVPMYMNPEWQADEFSRHFLCPLYYISNEDSIESVMQRFQVSKTVARIQLEIIKKDNIAQLSLNI